MNISTATANKSYRSNQTKPFSPEDAKKLREDAELRFLLAQSLDGTKADLDPRDGFLRLNSDTTYEYRGTLEDEGYIKVKNGFKTVEATFRENLIQCKTPKILNPYYHGDTYAVYEVTREPSAAAVFLEYTPSYARAGFHPTGAILDNYLIETGMLTWEK